MVCRVALEMLGCMLIGRRITTKRDATELTSSQVYPVVAGLYTCCAFVGFGLELRDEILYVIASFGLEHKMGSCLMDEQSVVKRVE